MDSLKKSALAEASAQSNSQEGLNKTVRVGRRRVYQVQVSPVDDIATADNIDYEIPEHPDSVKIDFRVVTQLLGNPGVSEAGDDQSDEVSANSSEEDCPESIDIDIEWDLFEHSTPEASGESDTSISEERAFSLMSTLASDTDSMNINSFGHIDSINDLDRYSVPLSLSTGQLTDGDKIRTAARIIGDKNETVKASVIVYEQLNIYDLSKSPTWYNKKSHSRAVNDTKWNVQCWMLNHCSSLVGWSDKKNKNVLVSKKNELVLQPSFLMYIENNLDAFTSFAGVKTLMTNLKRTISNEVASNKCCRVSPGTIYETLTWKKKPNDLKSYIKGNAGVNFNSDINSACWFFVNRMCELIVTSRSSSSLTFNKKLDKIHKKLESCQIDRKLGSGYSIELLKSCVNFNLAVQLIDDYGYSSGLVVDPRCREDDTEIVRFYESRKEGCSRVVLQKPKINLDFSSLDELDFLVIESLESIMDALEKEAVEIKDSMSRSIDRVSIELEEKIFEEKVLGLKKSDSGYYIDEPFASLRKRLKIIKGQRS